METWNERLTRARLDKKLSKTALARAVGVSQPTVTDWESGEMKPKGDNLLAVCRVLGISPEWLTKGTPTPHPTPAEPREEPGPALTPEESALLAAFHRLDERDRRKLLIEVKARADLAEIDREPPGDTQTPKDPPSDLCRDRRAQ